MPLTLVPPRQGFSKNWRIRGTVTVGGRSQPVNESTGLADRKLAEQYRKQRETEITRQLLNPEQAEPESHSFTQAALEYLEAANPTGTQRDAIIGYQRRKDGTTSPNLIDDIGTKPVSEIDQATVDEIARRRFAHCQPNTLVRQLITPLTAVLNFAAKPPRKWCEPPAFERPEYDDERLRWATYEEADRLLVATLSTNRHTALHVRQWEVTFLSTLLLFLMLTGARLSEALKLQWPDVDLQQRWLVFRSTKRNKRPRTRRAMRQADDRGGEDRGVPIHPQLQVALANLPDDHTEGAVFKTRFGLAYAERRRPGGGQIKRAWAGVCGRAGIADLTPHDLRHTCATWLLMAGVHEQVRDEIIGHASSKMGRRYAHVPRPELIAAIDKIPWRELPDAAPLAVPAAASAERAKSV